MKLKQILSYKTKQRLKKLKPLYALYHRFVTWKMTKARYNPYTHWVNHIEPNLWQAVVDDQKMLISVVVPIYNPPKNFLKKCVDSVLAQTYGNWQLVLVDDASTDSRVKKYLKTLSDPRIKVIYAQHNGHISKATNMGIEVCEGDFIALLDHDDLLAPQALNEVVAAIAANPNWQWLYSDEDFINENGARVVPHFKSDWNPFLLHAHNYITHFCVYKSDLLKTLKGCRVGFEGAQDYDLALRASEVLSSQQIGHISKILYHWRMHEGSTALNSDAKSYTVALGKKALTEHLQRKSINAVVDYGNLDNYFHVKYKPLAWPKVSIVIPTRDHKRVLETCIRSILQKTDYPDYEIVVMDNQTSDLDALSYLSTINKLKNINVFKHDKVFNYSEINNVAVAKANGEVVVLLNNDTEVISHDWLLQLVGLAMQPDVGCVGAKLLYPDQSIQHAGIVMGLGGYAAHSHRRTPEGSNGYFNRPHVNQVMSGVTGACLAIRKQTYLAVGGLDTDFQVAYNDVDFCLKVKSSGFYNVYCAGAQLYHFESKTRGDDGESADKVQRFDKEKALLLDRWQAEIEHDPYYSPHLTRDAEDFTIRLRY
ncbi:MULTISPECIES: glycosyltransferase family 2 protein [Colwellia]|uniref:Glycosyl transferase family 2 n=1 Tax=Colwellia marinimaniae TaxID=1513592 RepID=A0ABQ0MTP0_9GAMM|nr:MULTISPECIES: glycosyltransferase family 2 protein [Colwellia]GAW95743.1 glycosyl transferase family 2 [Colwellia marinimaniae]